MSSLDEVKSTTSEIGKCKAIGENHNPRYAADLNTLIQRVHGSSSPRSSLVVVDKGPSIATTKAGYVSLEGVSSLEPSRYIIEY